MPDYRLNSRSPYYIDGVISVTETTPPTPVEENTPPTVSITASNESPFINEIVTLTAVATDSDGTVVGYQWSTSETTSEIQVTSSSEGCIDFNVEVTDDDGDTANTTKRICWQKIPEIITNPATEVSCGETIARGGFTGEEVFSIVDVGDKIGDITISFIEPPAGETFGFVVPVNFSLEWNGITSSTGFVGSDEFDQDLLDAGVDSSDIATGSTTTKEHPTSLTLTKSAATPTQVLLKATTPLDNDDYEITINCPDPTDLATQTFFYTLVGTCTSGNTTFDYTDSNGDTQTVILSNGETRLVSAQEDSVSVAVCTGDSTKGGESFDNGTPVQEYDENTEIIILYDDTGSATSTREPLLSTFEGTLKNTLLQFYNNDVSKYNDNVKFYGIVGFRDAFNINCFPEDFLKLATKGKVNPSATKTIYMVFMDEVRRGYQDNRPYTGGYSDITSTYTAHLAEFRSFLDSANYGEYFLKMFKIDSYSLDNEFFFNIFNGTNGFDGSKGLSDRSEISIENDILIDGVDYSTNPYYYHDYIIQALRDYGFNI
jgi:hypothetical protein